MREGRRPQGLTRLRRATLNLPRGLRHCYRSEAAFRQEAWFACVLVPAGLRLGESGAERALLVGAMLVLPA